MKTMKTLVIFGHNDINKSNYSKAILEELRQHPRQEVTVKVLSEEYMNYKIDVASEQKALVENDRIVFIFPVQWYAVPSLLKRWQEDVLLAGFAYRKDDQNLGDKLKGKQVYCIATSAGDPEDYSASGIENYPIMDFFKVFEQTFRFCGMDVRLPMFYQGVYKPGRGMDGSEESQKSLEKLAKEAYAYISQDNVPVWKMHGVDLKPKLV